MGHGASKAFVPRRRGIGKISAALLVAMTTFIACAGVHATTAHAVEAKVTFDAEGGTFDGTYQSAGTQSTKTLTGSTENLFTADQLTDLPQPACLNSYRNTDATKGWSFGGWYDGVNCSGTKLDTTKDFTTKKDRTFHACWTLTPLDTVKIDLDSNSHDVTYVIHGQTDSKPLHVTQTAAVLDHAAALSSPVTMQVPDGTRLDMGQKALQTYLSKANVSASVSKDASVSAWLTSTASDPWVGTWNLNPQDHRFVTIKASQPGSSVTLYPLMSTTSSATSPSTTPSDSSSDSSSDKSIDKSDETPAATSSEKSDDEKSADVSSDSSAQTSGSVEKKNAVPQSQQPLKVTYSTVSPTTGKLQTRFNDGTTTKTEDAYQPIVSSTLSDQKSDQKANSDFDGLTVPKPSGSKHFIGWQTAADYGNPNARVYTSRADLEAHFPGAEAAVTSEAGSGQTAVLSLYSLSGFTATFNLNGGHWPDGSTGTKNVNATSCANSKCALQYSDVNALGKPSRLHWYLKNPLIWNSKPDGSGTWLLLNNNNTTYSMSGNETWYAVWGAKRYQINFNGNGGGVVNLQMKGNPCLDSYCWNWRASSYSSIEEDGLPFTSGTTDDSNIPVTVDLNGQSGLGFGGTIKGQWQQDNTGLSFHEFLGWTLHRHAANESIPDSDKVRFPEKYPTTSSDPQWFPTEQANEPTGQEDTLCASWTAEEFNLNDLSPVKDPTSRTPEPKYPAVFEPSADGKRFPSAHRPGYVFEGWTQGRTKCWETTCQLSDHTGTWTAQWEPVRYDVRFVDYYDPHTGQYYEISPHKTVPFNPNSNTTTEVPSDADITLPNRTYTTASGSTVDVPPLYEKYTISGWCNYYVDQKTVRTAPTPLRWNDYLKTRNHGIWYDADYPMLLTLLTQPDSSDWQKATAAKPNVTYLDPVRTIYVWAFWQPKPGTVLPSTGSGWQWVILSLVVVTLLLIAALTLRGLRAPFAPKGKHVA